MPRVKFDYVVSFSSEDPDNQANNLLANEISKKKWLCNKGEPSCSVVLQMTKAVKISAVHIGAYQASLVEVLVGRSENPSEPFQVLVASNVFISPTESRREQTAERVRSFTTEQLSGPARDQRWDRLRVVCSQPYNKHCKYGLSFIHVYEPEGTETLQRLLTSATVTSLPSRLLNLDTFSSDEDDFRPGELFAKYIESSQETESGNSNTEVQIRQATSQALRNITDNTTKLKKTPIQKANRRSNVNNETVNTDRQRDALLYEDDDNKPNDKVDRLIQQHRHDKVNNMNKNSIKEVKLDKKKETPDMNMKRQDKHRSDDQKHKPDVVADRRQPPQRDKHTTSSNNKTDGQESRKRTHSDNKKQNKKETVGAGDVMRLEAGPVSSSPHELLRNVVIVLSGYQNPYRSTIRNTALALGAACKPDWDRTSTHLICAFPNTPKLKQVRSSVGGSGIPIVTGEWIDQCAMQRRLLPWQWYATEHDKRVTPPVPHSDHTIQDVDTLESECDTDDEIEKVLQKQKKQRQDNNDAKMHSTPTQLQQQAQDEDSASTEADTDLEDHVQIDKSKALPKFFEGLTFLVSCDDSECDVTCIERYIHAYGGLLLYRVQAGEDCLPDYLITSNVCKGDGEHIVGPEWLWRCHNEQRLCPHNV